MFCRSCGKELEQGQAFCTFCGAKSDFATIQNNTPVTPKQPYAAQKSQPAFIGLPQHISCSSQGFMNLVTSGGIGLFAIILGAIFMCFGDFFTFMGGLIVFIGIVNIIIGIVVCVKYQKRFCDLKADSISGVTCGKTNFEDKPYDIKYADIFSVDKNSLTQLITIQTNVGDKYRIAIPGKYLDFVYSTIQNKIMSQN